MPVQVAPADGTRILSPVASNVSGAVFRGMSPTDLSRS